MRGDSRFAVRRLVLVNNPFAHRFVQLAGCHLHGLSCLLFIACVDGFAGTANRRFQLAFDRAVSLLGFQVGLIALNLRLNVRHVLLHFRRKGGEPLPGAGKTVNERPPHRNA